jgi:endoglucanase
VGYAPEGEKLATIEGTDLERTRFRVVRVTDDQEVFQGQVQAVNRSESEETKLYVADFSDVTAEEEYILDAGDAGRSPPFVIRPNPYAAAFQLTTQAMRLWRCGAAAHAHHDGEVFAHAACHLDDGYELGDDGEKRDATGGWHDAGDYNKYVVNAGISVGCLLRAWEDFHPAIAASEHANPQAAVPPFLEELRWELDWLLKMQRNDGSVCHKLSTLEFGGFVMPDEETERRYFSDWGTAATASLVAVTAAAARTFAPFDPLYAAKLRGAARRGHVFLVAQPQEKLPDLSPFRTGGYQTQDRDDRLWALAELWETTGDADLLARLESEIQSLLAADNGPQSERGDSSRRRRREYRGGVDVDWDWQNVKNLALVTYLTSVRPERNPELMASLQANLLRTADHIVKTAASHAYGRPLGDRYYWGCNGSVARQAIVLEAAYRIQPEKRYKNAQAAAVHYLFGRNPFGRSFVTGIGREPPLHPHDRRSAGDDVAAPWPGYLVGGPERGPLDWRDDQEDYRTNEIAINWNTALIYALASQLPPPSRGKGP